MSLNEENTFCASDYKGQVRRYEHSYSCNRFVKKIMACHVTSLGRNVPILQIS
jgi:hypothetical protein